MRSRPVPAVRAATAAAVPVAPGRVSGTRPPPTSTAPDLKPCVLCGRTNPRRMVALMTHWYGRYIDLPEDQGYFYLCPRCYAVRVRSRERAHGSGNPPAR
jgi:hypothetical protein